MSIPRYQFLLKFASYFKRTPQIKTTSLFFGLAVKEHSQLCDVSLYKLLLETVDLYIQGQYAKFQSQEGYVTAIHIKIYFM